jgi:glycosyltransferase involved in cell wall biosynthesis
VGIVLEKRAIMEDSLAVVLPYYNELGFLKPTLESLLAQARTIDQLILVNNGSTDGSEALCRDVLRDCSIPDVRFLTEPRPGKTFALEHASQHICTDLVAFTDADSYYPPQYVETAIRLFQQGGPGRVAVLAKDLSTPAGSWSGIWTRWFYSALARVLYWQTFSGGGCHVLRTAAYRATGGYSVDRWKFTLEDHEMLNRLRKVGHTYYHPNFWCISSPRRRDRSNVGWSFGERMVYHFTPPSRGDWFFQRFLAGRFQQRRIYQENLRQHDWNPVPESAAPVARVAA